MNFIARMTEEYIKPKHRQLIKATFVAPEGVETVHQAALHFDVIAIERWSRLGAKQEEFDRLRQEFPETFFLVIYQSTVAGTSRGGSIVENDAGMVVQVQEGLFARRTGIVGRI